MTRIHSTLVAAGFLALGASLVSCGTQNTSPTSQPAAAFDTRAQDEAEIRALDGEWSKVAEAKDIPKIMTYYADSASMLEPGATVAKGKEEIQKRWQSTFAAPGTSLSFAPTSIEVARSGDLAYDLGTYELTAPDKKGKPQTTKGVYVVVWAKQPGGQWKVVLDGPTSATP